MKRAIKVYSGIGGMRVLEWDSEDVGSFFRGVERFASGSFSDGCVYLDAECKVMLRSGTNGRWLIPQAGGGVRVY